MLATPNRPIPTRPPDTLDLVLIAGRLGEIYTDEAVTTLSDEARERGWRLMDYIVTEGSLTGEAAPIGGLTTLLPTNPILSGLLAGGCPLVRLGRLEHPDDESVPAVLPDFREAGRMAAEYFAQRGFVSVALFGHTQMELMPLVEKGLREEAEALGCTVYSHQITNAPGILDASQMGAARFDRRSQALIDWVNNLPKPLGVLACAEFLAGMFISTCRRGGLSIPEDVAVLAIGNDRAACELAAVPISAIHFSQGNMMRVAIELLSRRIQGQAIAPRTFIQPTHIVTRRSTDILAVSDPLVARAIRYIWDHMKRDLTVDDVAHAMHMPRYRLERLFNKHLNRGIHAELRRFRLAQFAQLLRTTDLPLRTLAPQVGFRSAKFLHDSFCKAYGLTPRQYRLTHRDSE